MPPAKRRPKGAGRIRQLPSGKYQARFPGPDGVMRSAGSTFETRLDANAWLTAQARAVTAGRWEPPTGRERLGADTLRTYAEGWLSARDLKPRTRIEYAALLDTMILPTLGDLALPEIKPTTVRAWHAGLDSTKPTRRAHAYSLLRAVLMTAVADDLIQSNPCRVSGAGSAPKQHDTTVASLAELDVIVAAVPARYRAMVLLAAWCGLRFGELTELRRKDIVLDVEDATGLVRIERGVVRAGGGFVVGEPKSAAGRRRVSVPPHLVQVLAGHLEQHVAEGAEALLFPARRGGHMAPASLYKVWYAAREKAGRADLHFHDLRHTGLTMAAQEGATLAELMGRAGHSTPAAALVYQHVAAGRDAILAAKLSARVAAPSA